MYIYIYTYTHRISTIYHWYQVDQRGFRSCWPEEHIGVPSKRSVQTNMRKHVWICMVYTSISKKCVYMCISLFYPIGVQCITLHVYRYGHTLRTKCFPFFMHLEKKQMAIANSSNSSATRGSNRQLASGFVSPLRTMEIVTPIKNDLYVWDAGNPGELGSWLFYDHVWSSWLLYMWLELNLFSPFKVYNENWEVLEHKTSTATVFAHVCQLFCRHAHLYKLANTHNFNIIQSVSSYDVTKCHFS